MKFFKENISFFSNNYSETCVVMSDIEQEYSSELEEEEELEDPLEEEEQDDEEKEHEEEQEFEEDDDDYLKMMREMGLTASPRKKGHSGGKGTKFLRSKTLKESIDDLKKE